jgi:hypothetical protein
MVALYEARIKLTVQHVAERDGWDLVLDNFDHDTGKQALLPYDVHSLLRQGLPNITDAIVEEFNRKYK